jgi:hypothetical protein
MDILSLENGIYESKFFNFFNKRDNNFGID